MKFNSIITVLAALIPIVIGAIWYNPKVFGNVWMQASGLSKKDMEGANMVKIFILAFIFSFLLAFILNTLVIHQFGFFSSIMSEPGWNEAGTDVNLFAKEYMERFGNTYRTFGHGALHGTMAGLFVALPVLGTNALFERKSFKYIAVNVGYWIVSLALMGGVICQFA